MSDVESGRFSENLHQVTQRIRSAAQRAGRNPEDIRLLPVTKTVSLDRLRDAINQGLEWLGENKVQEASQKHAELSQEAIGADLKWSVIGPLQSNKTRDVARFADEFQALDRIKIARRLHEQLGEFDRVLDVFVQINTSGEETKSGLNPDELPEFLAQLAEFDRLKVTGLMTIAENTSDVAHIRENFQKLARLRDENIQSLGPGDLSMGMTADFELAIEEGATVVRVGSALFGARPQ